MRRADLTVGEDYAVKTYRNPPHSRRRDERTEILKGRVRGLPTGGLVVEILPQEVRRNDGRQGTVQIPGHHAEVSPAAIQHTWAVEEQQRAERKAQQDAMFAEVRREMDERRTQTEARIRALADVFDQVEPDRFMRTRGESNLTDQLIDQLATGGSSSLTMTLETLEAVVHAARA